MVNPLSNKRSVKESREGRKPTLSLEEQLARDSAREQARKVYEKERRDRIRAERLADVPPLTETEKAALEEARLDAKRAAQRLWKQRQAQKKRLEKYTLDNEITTTPYRQ